MARKETGSALPLTALVAAVLLASMSYVVDAANSVTAKAQAQTAADAAALAAVTTGDLSDATAAARANNGELVSASVGTSGVTVKVVVRGHTASAKATS